MAMVAVAERPLATTHLMCPNNDSNHNKNSGDNIFFVCNIEREEDVSIQCNMATIDCILIAYIKVC